MLCCYYVWSAERCSSDIPTTSAPPRALRRKPISPVVTHDGREIILLSHECNETGFLHRHIARVWAGQSDHSPHQTLKNYTIKLRRDTSSAFDCSCHTRLPDVTRKIIILMHRRSRRTPDKAEKNPFLNVVVLSPSNCQLIPNSVLSYKHLQKYIMATSPKKTTKDILCVVVPSNLSTHKCVVLIVYRCVVFKRKVKCMQLLRLCWKAALGWS